MYVCLVEGLPGHLPPFFFSHLVGELNLGSGGIAIPGSVQKPCS